MLSNAWFNQVATAKVIVLLSFNICIWSDGLFDFYCSSLSISSSILTFLIPYPALSTISPTHYHLPFPKHPLLQPPIYPSPPLIPTPPLFSSLLPLPYLFSSSPILPFIQRAFYWWKRLTSAFLCRELAMWCFPFGYNIRTRPEPDVGGHNQPNL